MPSEVRDLPATRIATVLNGRPERANVVRNMAFPPYELVAFHSHVMPGPGGGRTERQATSCAGATAKPLDMPT
ncbi:MAG: hypothetical protein AABZ16_13445, partial [candidate division NC10 bacterium]